MGADLHFAAADMAFDDLAKIKQEIRNLVTTTLDSTNFWEAFDNLINGLGELTGDDFFDDGVEEVTT